MNLFDVLPLTVYAARSSVASIVNKSKPLISVDIIDHTFSLIKEISVSVGSHTTLPNLKSKNRNNAMLVNDRCLTLQSSLLESKIYVHQYFYFERPYLQDI